MDALRDTPHPVRFPKEADQTLVLLTQEDYLDLLVRSSVTDPESWPPGKEAGAQLLARIRQIEQDCVKEHGKWDWELLSEDLQDEYDCACIDLNELRCPDTGQRYTLKEIAQEFGIKVDEL